MVSLAVWCRCFWTFKLSYDVDILAFFGLATFSKNWAIFIVTGQAID
jgi:hypothetical protein